MEPLSHTVKKDNFFLWTDNGTNSNRQTDRAKTVPLSIDAEA